MGEVLLFSGATTLPLPVERVLDAARGCTAVLVLGEAADGTVYAAASTGDGGTLLWWIETFKHKLLSGDYAGGEP
jgi:hypothetical protein